MTVLVDRIDRLVGKSHLKVREKAQCLRFVLEGIQGDLLCDHDRPDHEKQASS